MKNKLFDKNLYVEGMRQIRTGGIIHLVIQITIILLQFMTYMVNYHLRNYGVDHGIETIDFAMYNFAIFSNFIFAPLYALSLFDFLNKRSKSDFYHAIPETRKCLYSSFYLSIVSVVLVNILVPTLLSFFLKLFIPFIEINVASIFITLFNVFAISLFFVAIALIAMSVTGRTISNIVVSGLIFLVPIIFLAVLLSLTAEKIPLVDSSRLFSGIDHLLRLRTGEFLKTLLFNVEFTKSVFLGIYYFIAAAVYSFLGLILFDRRKSETAERSASSRLVQSIARIIFTLTICLIPIAVIISQGTAEISVLITLYTVAVVAYFLFEIITTKSVKMLLKILPGLLVVAVLNVVIIVSLNISSLVVLNYSPKAENIDSISFMDDGDTDFGLFYSYSHYSRNSYFKAKESKITITDKEIISKVADALNRNIKSIRNGKDPRYDYFYYKDEGGYNSCKTVAIRQKGITKYRKIYFYDTEWDNILEKINQTGEYKGIYTDLPASKEVKLSSYEFSDVASFKINRGDGDVLDSKLSKEDKMELYNSLREELKTANLGQLYYWYDQGILLGNASESVLGYISVIQKVDGKEYVVTLPICKLFPKTMNLYLQKFDGANQADKEKILSDLKNNKNTKNYYDFDITIADSSKRNYKYDYGNISSLLYEEWGKLYQCLLPTSNEIPTLSDDIIRLTNGDKTYYFKIDLEMLPDELKVDSDDNVIVDYVD